MTIPELCDYKKIYHSQLFDSCLKFWLESDLLDKEYGGYITSVDRGGRLYNDDKSVWFQGRGLWTFSAIMRKYGVRDELLEAAELGKSFLTKYCTDTDGRMFFTTTREGKPLRKRRYMFSEGFFVIGMAEYGALMKDASALDQAGKCFDMMMRIYDHAETDPYKITPKEYASTRECRSAAVPMILINAAQILRRCIPDKAERYSKIIDDLINDLKEYHIREDLSCVLETVLTDKSRLNNPTGRTVNPGHSCENAWFIMNEAVYKNDKSLLQTALNILDWSLELGWDHEYGGIYYFRDIDGRPCEQLEADMKLWWVHNEALIATLFAYSLTRNEKYLAWFEKIHQYTFSHFVDNEYGEWYGYLHRDGTVSHTQKGSMWKGPYHLPRCLMICEELLDKIIKNKPITPIV